MSEGTTTFFHPWSEEFIGNIGQVTVGGTPRTSIEKYWDGEVPWMASGDVHLKHITDVPRRITELGLRFSNATLVDPPAVAIGLAGQGRTRGTVALVLTRLCTNQSVALISANPAKLDTEYLFYNLEFRYEELRARSAGDGRAGLSKQLIEQIPVPLPPLCEQDKIAEVLSTVDQAIERTEALIAKQKRIKTGLMQDLLTRGIDEHGNLRSESTHEFKDSPLGRIPVEWQENSLESVSEFVTSGSRGWAQYYSTEGALFLRIGNLTRSHINLRFDDSVMVSPPPSSEGKRTSVRTGDLLVSITADLGIIGVVPPDFGEAYVNQHIALVRLLPDVVCPRFIGWFLSGRGGQLQFEALNESGAKAGLNLPTIRRLKVPLPELKEQMQIAKVLDKATKRADEYYQRGVKLRSLKTALMQDLLTGKKRVTPLLTPESSC
jgi:type I restriction enzyme S subunit